MALLTQNREASARGRWAFTAWLLLKGQWFCTIMWVKQYWTITQITINRWSKPSQMGGLFLFYPHYMIMTLETLTRAWLIQKHWLFVMDVLWPGLPAEAAAAAKAGLTDHGFAAHEISLLNVGRPNPGPILEDLPGRFTSNLGKNPGRCEWIYKDGREWLWDLQRHGDHKQKETLHGFPLANSLHILSLLGITALNGLSSTSSFCL